MKPDVSFRHTQETSVPIFVPFVVTKEKRPCIITQHSVTVKAVSVSSNSQTG